MATHRRTEPGIRPSTRTVPPPASAQRLAAVVAEVGRRRAVELLAADLDEVQAGRQLGGEVDDDGVAARRRGVDGGRDGRRRVDHDEVARVAATSTGRGRCSGGAAPRRSTPSSARRRGGRASARAARWPPARAAGRSGRGRRSGRWPGAHAATTSLAPVPAARLVAVDQGEDGRARCPRAAGGRRCPRRGRRPGASGCACRRGRWSAPAGRGARRRAPGRRGRGPPWWRRSRPSPRRPRPTASDVMSTTTAPGGEVRQRRLDQADRRDDVDGEQVGEGAERVVGERRQRRRAEPAGVVDEQVDRPAGGGRPGRRDGRRR